MVMFRRMTTGVAFSVAVLTLAACSATSTAGNYHPANCAMVGSRCSSNR